MPRGKLIVPPGAAIIYGEPGIFRKVKKEGANLYQVQPAAKDYYYHHPEISHPSFLEKLEKNQKLLIQHFPDPENPSQPHPYLVKVATYEHVGVSRPDMPEFGNEVNILQEGYMYLKDLEKSDKSEGFKAFSNDIFLTVPRASSVRQATWADCFLLANILALLKNDKAGEQFFENMMRQEGEYTIVRLYHPETLQPCYVKIENSIYHQKKDKAINHHELWIHILEKAYAGFGWQLKNSDQPTQSIGAIPNMYGKGGVTSLAMTILTGNKAESHFFSKEETTPLPPWDFAATMTASLLPDIVDEEQKNNLLSGLKNAPAFAALGDESLLREWGEYVKRIAADPNKENFNNFNIILNSWPADSQVTQMEATNFLNQLANLSSPPPLTIMTKFREYVFSYLNNNRGERVYNYPGGSDAPGVYNQEQITCYDDLESKLNEHYIISAGTTDKAESAMGLRPNHAYAVIGVVSKTIDSQTIKFVKVMNPWHQVGRSYDFVNQQQYEIVGNENGYIQEDQNLGTFDIELKDFVHYFSNYAYCTPLKEPSSELNLSQATETVLTPPLPLSPATFTEKLTSAWQEFKTGVSQIIDSLLPHTKKNPSIFDKLVRLSVGIVVFPFVLAAVAFKTPAPQAATAEKTATVTAGSTTETIVKELGTVSSPETLAVTTEDPALQYLIEKHTLFSPAAKKSQEQPKEIYSPPQRTYNWK
jgi:hypothetical protein